MSTSMIPDPAGGLFAAAVAAENAALDAALNHPPAGVFPLPPRPRRSIARRIGERLLLEERDRQQRELAIELYGYLPPDAKEVA